MLMPAILVLGLSLFMSSEAALGISKATGFISGVVAATKGTVNRYVFDLVDVKGLEIRYRDVFEQIKKRLGTSTCVQGLNFHLDKPEKTLQLTNGELTDVDTLVMNPRILSEEGETVTYVISFIFPTLSLKYSFDYTDFRVVTQWHRTGLVKLKQEGQNTVQFTVQSPKSQKKIDETLSSKSCAATVTDVKTIFVQNTLTVEDVDYQSLGRSIGLGLTGRSVTNLLRGLKEDIQRDIEAALRPLVEDAFRNFPFNCKDDSYTAQDAVDCHASRTATSYDAHPVT